MCKSINEAEAKKVTGFLKSIRQDRWVAVAGTNWWAANKALDLLDPVFTVTGTLIGNDSIDAALEAAFDSGDEARLFERGNVESLFDGAKIITSEYQAAPALHRSEEHTYELQSLMRISYAVFFLKKKNTETYI